MKLFDKLLKRQCGFTMVESLATIGIAGIIIAAITGTFITQQKMYDKQEDITFMMQATRNAMDIMSREIRMAGYTTRSDATFDSIPIHSAMEVRIQTDLDGNGATNDPNETVRYAYDAPNKRILRDNGVSEIIAENIDSLTFEYKRADGSNTSVSSEIREIKINIIGKAANKTYTLTSFVTPTNLEYSTYTR